MNIKGSGRYRGRITASLTAMALVCTGVSGQITASAEKDAILAVEPGNDKRSYLFTTNVARHD